MLLEEVQQLDVRADAKSSPITGFFERLYNLLGQNIPRCGVSSRSSSDDWKVKPRKGANGNKNANNGDLMEAAGVDHGIEFSDGGCNNNRGVMRISFGKFVPSMQSKKDRILIDQN